MAPPPWRARRSGGRACTGTTPHHKLNAVAEKKRRILTGEDVQAIPEGGILDVPPGTLLTDIAREWVQKRKIRVVEQAAPSDTMEVARVAVGCDHAGFPLKAIAIAELERLGHEVLDLGTHSDEAVDYPDFAQAVAEAVMRGKARPGLPICRRGLGPSVPSNQGPGTPAALMTPKKVPQAAVWPAPMGLGSTSNTRLPFRALAAASPLKLDPAMIASYSRIFSSRSKQIVSILSASIN